MDLTDEQKRKLYELGFPASQVYMGNNNGLHCTVGSENGMAFTEGNLLNWLRGKIDRERYGEITIKVYGPSNMEIYLEDEIAEVVNEDSAHLGNELMQVLYEFIIWCSKDEEMWSNTIKVEEK
jgi:hypothetical protein